MDSVSIFRLKPTLFGPIDRASPYLRIPAQTQDSPDNCINLPS
jgi:hypothetical protein